MPFLDSHCHLDRFFREGNLPAILDRAKAAEVNQLVTIGTEPEDWSIYRELVYSHPNLIAYTVGLHPNEVKEDWQQVVAAIDEHLVGERRPVAVGEIGLDYFRLPKDESKAAPLKDLQKAAFASQLALAKQVDLPVVIHCRDSFNDCLRCIDDAGIDWAKVVFHCFSEGPDQVLLLRERGGRASFTGIITYGSAENVRQAALAQGLDRLMLETDCPYLAPAPHRGNPNEPAFLRHTAKFCADLFEIDLETLGQLTTLNARTFYGLE